MQPPLASLHVLKVSVVYLWVIHKYCEFSKWHQSVILENYPPYGRHKASDIVWKMEVLPSQT